MPVRVIQLGSPRAVDEGLRIGTVRRPPRGVPKAEFSVRDWYDVWFPNLAPSADAMKLGQSASTEAEWLAFSRRYMAEMSSPEAKHAIHLLAALSHGASFSFGCYCQNDSRCHRSLLRGLLADAGAKFAQASHDGVA